MAMFRLYLALQLQESLYLLNAKKNQRYDAFKLS
jgi:hypothetical protein